MPPEPQYSMLSINLNLIQNAKLQKKCIHDICLCYSYMVRCGISYKTRKLQKNVFMIYAHVIHTCSDVALATKLENYKKNVFMIYAYVIHTCLDVALATKLQNFKKMHS